MFTTKCSKRLAYLGLSLAAGLVPGVVACGSDGLACNVNADCGSGVCRSDGTCAAPTIGSDGGTSGAQQEGAQPEAGGQVPGDGAAGSDAPRTDSGLCQPNNDGIIERSEVAFVAGAHANFRVAQSVTVDTAGQKQADGSRVWDFSGALAGDHDMKLETEDPKAGWYAADFTGATVAAKISDTQSLRGVYQATNTAILMTGLVSPSGGSSKTELTLVPPVPVLQFPLQDGSTWSTSPTVSGVTSGVPTTVVQVYDSTVDAHGTLVTPLGTFRVLRIATNVTGALVYTRQFSFVTECLGTVATVTSQNGESAAEFTTAAEIQRLAP